MRTALVTGGSSGIGLQFVKQLLDEGWKVITGSRNAENCGFLYIRKFIQKMFNFTRKYIIPSPNYHFFFPIYFLISWN